MTGLSKLLESARQANLVKSRFLANMSHALAHAAETASLGSPNYSMTNYWATCPRNRKIDGRHSREWALSARSRKQSADLERAELGRIELSLRLVDVPRLLKEVCDVLRTLADDNGVKVSVTADPALSAVTTDPIRLRQIVYNYLSNAIKFSPAESLVQVRAIRIEGAGFRVRFPIIAPVSSRKSFRCCLTIFSDWTVPEKRPGQGAGLGLRA